MQEKVSWQLDLEDGDGGERDMERGREGRALTNLLQQLDMLYNPGESMLEKKWERERGKKEAKKRKGRRGKELPATGDAAVDRVDRDDSGDGGEDKGTAGAIV